MQTTFDKDSMNRKLARHNLELKYDVTYPRPSPRQFLPSLSTSDQRLISDSSTYNSVPQVRYTTIINRHVLIDLRAASHHGRQRDLRNPSSAERKRDSQISTFSFSFAKAAADFWLCTGRKSIGEGVNKDLEVGIGQVSFLGCGGGYFE